MLRLLTVIEVDFPKRSDFTLLCAKDSMANLAKHEALALRHAVSFFLLFAQPSRADQLKARHDGRR